MTNKKSLNVPDTSTTLLLQLGSDANHARWTEFVKKYRPMMEDFLAKHFPALEWDDVIQETFIALVKALPNYKYSPDETGYFHNYLTGILQHKAIRAAKKNARQRKLTLKSVFSGRQLSVADGADNANDEWKLAVYEIAVRQLLNDETIAAQTRDIFRSLVLRHEDPTAVAEKFNVSRNNVDQIKNRMIKKLRAIVERLKKAM